MAQVDCDDRQGGFPAAAAAGEHLGVRTHIGLEDRFFGMVNSSSIYPI